MRIAFFLLVLANLLFFVWAQGYLGGPDEGREPQRLADQLHAGKMKVTVVEKKVAVPPPQACRLIDGLAAADAEHLQKALGGNGGELVANVRLGEETPAWWVNINSLANKALADKKAGELKLLGVTDFHVMQTEGGSFAISLGIFDNEATATEFLQSLAKKGVKSARIDARPRPPTSVRVEVRGPAEAIGRRLPGLLAGLPAARAAECP